jgi:hypothetical protein
MTPEQLVEILAVRRIVDGIDSAVDDKDWPKVRAAFADMVRVDFTSLAGGEPATIPADALVDGWTAGLHAKKASHHMRTNHQIAIEGDRARVVSRGYAWNKLAGRNDLWETWGVYEHELARTPLGWKVDRMTYRALANRGDDGIRTHLLGG